MVAAHRHSRFEQHSHERVGRQVGLTDIDIAALRQTTPPDLTDAEETAVATATRRILDHRTLTDTQYAEAAAVLGPAGLFELTVLIGYYELLALQMHVFGVD